MKRQFDIIIVGAGIVGLMIARFLSRYHLRILVVEKETEVCKGTSGANSATIHTGHSAPVGTLKADMNVKGNVMWDTISSELQIPLERRGDYVVAIGDNEVPVLQQLIMQGKSNGVLGLSVISGEEMRRREPKVNPNTSGALWSANTGLCDPWIAAVATAENAIANGVLIYLGTHFDDFVFDGKQIVGIKTNRGIFGSRWVINAAGVYADEIMHKSGIHPEFTIAARKGQYLLLDGEKFPFVNLLSPIPSKISKGIAIKPTIDQGVLLGSNAEIVMDKDDLSVTPAGLSEVWVGASKLVPSLDHQHVIAVFAGLRASGNAICQNNGVNYQADFLIERAEKIKGIINIAGIESPGLTAAPAIAIHVIELLKDAGEKLEVKTDWNPRRPEHKNKNFPTIEDRAKLLKRARCQETPHWFK